MKKLLTIIFILTSVVCYPVDNRKILISEIIANIENFKNKTIEGEFRLKYLDRIFEKIVFYDSENADIEFDISGKTKKKELTPYLLNVHEGMIYKVKFTVIGAGTLGGLTGDLIEFTPVIIDSIPDNPLK